MPDAFSLCAPEDREDGEVDVDIPLFEASAMVVTRAQATARETKKSIPKEAEVDHYYI